MKRSLLLLRYIFPFYQPSPGKWMESYIIWQKQKAATAQNA